jgi:predicted DCC family thiol-disulfide oxidoreductase YuxK
VTQQAKPVVVFDGVCNLCNRTVDLLVKLDRREHLLFASNQSQAGIDLLGNVDRSGESANTIYLVEQSQTTSESDAILRIARTLGFPWRFALVGVLMPRPARNALYRWVAKNRYRWFGTRETCRLPTEAEQARFLG